MLQVKMNGNDDQGINALINRQLQGTSIKYTLSILIKFRIFHFFDVVYLHCPAYNFFFFYSNILSISE